MRKNVWKGKIRNLCKKNYVKKKLDEEMKTKKKKNRNS